ncbi:MAG: hypothetical protein KKD07_09700 [Candidatus Omnitrophica bacterium]|nr:hypothetical protein [Candidatus Omnitrophota bacterium]
MSKEYDRVHLLTFKRFGLFCMDNIKYNIPRLKDSCGKDKFLHKVIDINKLFEEVSYNRYLHYLKKYNFMVLSTCGLCKLSMHVRALIYCVENNVKYVCDGSNKYSGNGYFPAQMPSVINELKKMYSLFDIEYLTPVLEFNEPPDIGWFDRLGIKENSLIPSEQNNGPAGETTGSLLHKMNFFPENNVKGTKLDHKMQARCFQLILFNIFLYGYYLPLHGEKPYLRTTHLFFKDKIDDAIDLINSYFNDSNFSSNIIKH